MGYIPPREAYTGIYTREAMGGIYLYIHQGSYGRHAGYVPQGMYTGRHAGYVHQGIYTGRHAAQSGPVLPW